MIEVAKVLKPQGIRGELKLEPFAKDESFWKNVKHLQIESKTFDVLGVRTYKNFVYVLLSTIDDCNKAEALRGKIVFANQNLISKKENEFLIAELVGLQVVGEDGKFFGVVESVEKYGAADIINILCGGARKSFPFLNAVIKSVDVDCKKIVVFENKLLEVLV